MVVADGMGGHYYGEIASQIAAQTLTDAFNRDAKPMLQDPFLFLQRGMTNAHHAILDFAADHDLRDSPRTTCVACVIQDNIAYWAHCGDSRLYLMRDGRTIGQTRDHSRVRLLIDQGVITEAQAASHPSATRSTAASADIRHRRSSSRARRRLKPATSSCSAPTVSGARCHPT